MLVLALAVYGQAAAVPNFPSYEGVDQSQIPQALRRFFLTGGLPVTSLSVHGAHFSYVLESAPIKTPWVKLETGRVTDDVFVDLDMYATAAEADKQFDYLKGVADRNCAYMSSLGARCETVALGANVYGKAYISGEDQYPRSRPHVQDDYAIRIRGADNIVIQVKGRIASNWTSSDVASKTIAAELAKLAGAPEAAPLPPPPPPPPPPPLVPPSALAAKVQAAAVEAWLQTPPLEEVKVDYGARPSSGNYLVYSEAKGGFACLPKVPNLPVPTQRPSGGDFRLLRARELLQAALRAMGLSEADIAALREGVAPLAANVPVAVRERAYILWGPGRIRHYLYDAQLVLSPAEGAPGLQKIDWELPPEPCPVYSSEHSSVRGTINGGGDFIRYQPAPADRRGSPLLIRTALRALAAAAARETVVELPGAVVTLSPDAVAAIDLAPSGVTAVALLAGSAVVVERASGSSRTLGPDKVALSVPTLGVSPPIPLDADSRDALRLIVRAPAPYLPAAGRITEIRTARQVAWGEPVGAAESFSPDVNPIFVWFRHSGLSAGARIGVVWTYLETAQPREIGRGEVTVTPPSDWGQFSYELEAGKAWPPGRYRVALSIDGRPAGEAHFRILSPGPAAAAVPEVYRDPAGGYELTIPPGWTRVGGTQGFGLVNAAGQIAIEATVQHAADAIPNDQLYAVVRDAFRSDADYELVRSEPRRLTAAGRAGYLMVLRSKADRHALVVVLAGRSPGSTSRDHYVFKALSNGEDSSAVLAALDQILAGFRIVE